MRRLAMILLSGGLDSATVAALACRQGYEAFAMTVHYGQVHGREVESARQVAKMLGLRHKIVDVSFFKELAWYSALTQPDRFPMPKNRTPALMAENIPITYVPLRNTFFLTLAAAYLESEVLHLIEMERVAAVDLSATILIAANAIDYSGYPDCRPEFYETIVRTLQLGSKLGTQYGIHIKVETPLIDKDKAEIVRLAFEVHAPLEHTWSCYRGGPTPCGECDSCLLRAKGFDEAGLPDPALRKS